MTSTNATKEETTAIQKHRTVSTLKAVSTANVIQDLEGRIVMTSTNVRLEFVRMEEAAITLLDRTVVIAREQATKDQTVTST